MLFGETEEPEVGSFGEVSAATPNRSERERYSLPVGIRETLCPGLTFWEEIPEEAKEEPLFGAVATLSMTAGLEELADLTPSKVDFVLATPRNEGEEPDVPTLNKLPKRPDAPRGEEPDAPAFCRASKLSAGASPTGDEDKSGATAGRPATDEGVKECGIPPAASTGMLELALEDWVSSGPDLSVLPVLKKS